MPIVINAAAMTPMSVQAYVSAACASIVRSRRKFLRLSPTGLLKQRDWRRTLGQEIIAGVERELEVARDEPSLAAPRYELVVPATFGRELKARWNGALEWVAELEGRIAVPAQSAFSAAALAAMDISSPSRKSRVSFVPTDHKRLSMSRARPAAPNCTHSSSLSAPIEQPLL